MLKHKGSCCKPAKPSPIHLQNLCNSILGEDAYKWKKPNPAYEAQQKNRKLYFKSVNSSHLIIAHVCMHELHDA